MARKKREIPLVHPGEILIEEFLKPLGLTVNALALALRVPSNRMYAIAEGGRGISPDTALRLGRYFGTGPEFWLNLQGHDPKPEKRASDKLSLGRPAWSSERDRGGPRSGEEGAFGGPDLRQEA